ncbi:MAG: hypothetical protein U0U70_01740 [Chitinophagaceae bacterium]
MAEMKKISSTIWYDPDTGKFREAPESEKELSDSDNRQAATDSMGKQSSLKNSKRPVTRPEIVYFKTDKTVLTDKKPATISWKVNEVSTVRVNNKKVVSEGNMLFHCMQPEEITLVAKNKSGETVSQTIQIDTDNTAPTIEFFTSDKNTVIKNYPIELSWKVTGAERITINNGIGDVTSLSEIMIFPSAKNCIYTLKAQNYFGISSQRSVPVQTIPAPVIETVYIQAPKFDFQKVLIEPLKELPLNGQTNIYVKLPAFASTIPFTELDKIANHILFNEKLVNSVLFPNNIFQTLSAKQKQTTHLIHSIWKKKIRESIRKLIHPAKTTSQQS